MKRDHSSKKNVVHLGFAIALGFLALTLAPATAAADACTSRGCLSKISKLYVRANGEVLVSPKDGDVANLNCNPVSNAYMTLSPKDLGYKAMYSLLLSAFLAKRAVYVRIVDGSNGCQVAYITIVD